MEFQRIGFLGCGNMGSALARAAAKQSRNLLLANRTPAKAEALAGELGAQVADNGQVARDCDLIFLGVKPQMMAGLLAELAPVFLQRKDRFILVTMAAGLTMEAIRSMAGGDYPVIRIMPNTPASIGAGMILYCVQEVEPKELEAFCALMSGAGRLDELPEGRRQRPVRLRTRLCLSLYRGPGGWCGGLWSAPSQGPAVRGPDPGGGRQAGAGERSTSRRAEGRGVLPRRLHHPGGPGSGAGGLPQRRYGGGYRRLSEDRGSGKTVREETRQP